jgi:hypothetical protein
MSNPDHSGPVFFGRYIGRNRRPDKGENGWGKWRRGTRRAQDEAGDRRQKAIRAADEHEQFGREQFEREYFGLLSRSRDPGRCVGRDRPRPDVQSGLVRSEQTNRHVLVRPIMPSDGVLLLGGGMPDETGRGRLALCRHRIVVDVFGLWRSAIQPYRRPKPICVPPGIPSAQPAAAPIRVLCWPGAPQSAAIETPPRRAASA